MATNFTTKVNKRLVGMDQLISSEPHVIPAASPYVIRLAELPLLDLGNSKDVVIPTFTRVESAPAVGQFQVDFTDGRITFNSADSGTPVSVDYYGLGSINDADDINDVQTAINALENMFLGPIASDPGSPSAGQIWFNTTDFQFKGYNGTDIVLLG